MKVRIGTQGQVNVWRLVKRFLIIFLPLALLLASILAVFYYQEVKNKRDTFEMKEIQYLSYQTDIISSAFQSVVPDLMFLANQNELQRMLESGEVGWREALAEEYLSFAAIKGLYDQIRFLDENGIEIVRINFNDGKPSILPDEQLQSKAERYYFIDTFLLGQGEVYVSPFDLNIEQGEIEQPLKPMIRFGISVFDSHGQKRGIVVLNYFGANLLYSLEEMFGNSSQFMLLNSDGFWLKSPMHEDEWGFMLEERSDRTFGNDFPEAWQRISAAESGQFYDAGGLFTFTTVYPLIEGQKSSTGSKEAFERSAEQIKAKEYYWKVISYISPDTLNIGAGAIVGRFLQIYAVVVVILGAGSYWLVSIAVRRKRVEEALLESEEKYSVIFNEARDGIVLINGQTGNIVDCNPEFERQTGRNIEQLREMKVWEVRPPEKIEAAKEKFLNIRERETGGSAELEFQRPDGEIVPVQFVSKSITIGGEHYLQSMVRNITEFRQLEHDLRQRVKELQCLYGIAYIAERPGFTLDELCQEVVNLLPAGWQYPEITCARITLGDKEFKTDNFKTAEWKQAANISVKGQKEGTVEVYYLEARPEINEGPFLKEERLLIDVIAQRLGKITEREWMEAELRSSEERLRILFEFAPDACYLNDLRGNFIDGNKMAEEITGYKKDELIGKSFLKLKLLSVRQMPKAAALLARNTLGQATGPDEFILNRKDGNQVPVEIKTFPVKIKGKTLVLGIARDITERKRMERELQEKNEQLDVQNEELQSQTEELITQRQELIEKTGEVERANQLKSEFLANMSHGLRTPLNVIIGFSELMRDEVPGKLNKEQRQCLGDVLGSSQHLLNLINKVLDLSKIESGKTKLNLTNLALTEVIESLARTMMPILAPRQQSLDIEIEGGLPLVHADKAKVSEVLLNLLSNATRFTPDGGRLKIEAVREGDWCRVSVIDNGIGIKEEDQELIFEPFHQLDNPLTKEKNGTGLGLALVKQIIEKHGGQIWVESEYGKRSRFTFTLPLTTTD